MFLSIFYMYSTLLQWWRLGALRIKLNGTLSAQNALLVCKDSVIYDPKKPRCFENLLFKNGDRIACTIVPKQKINLAHWAVFPRDLDGFPIYFKNIEHANEQPFIYVLVQAILDNYFKDNSVVIDIENFGDLLAWKVTENFEAILRTDLDKLTKLVICFSENENIDINHELKLLRIETVNIEGHAARLKYVKKYTIDKQMKYSHSPVHWRKFSSDVRELYSKLRQETNPKITIESGSAASSTKSDDGKKVPISEVKPIKKEIKNTLEVNSRQRHKSKDRQKSTERPKTKESKRPLENGVTSGEKPEKHKQKRERKKLKDAFKSDSLGKRVDDGCSTVANGTIGKPPNILVYADSQIAKENVKEVLENIINKEKYTIYDLPTNPSVQTWNSSTSLVVVCGTVPPNLTNNLLQYLINGGQLLCLCSDLLYSVLHTFTTAEVREHELVRFSYDQWKQVKMMHHIFCYQASPAKKQFSKDSDHSNPGSGNGSSPIAPRTPSTVEIQHNGQDYVIQVQVLGAEETWQTPSLLLASVKGSKGRAIFSQVHLEINPNQYEDDENKFAALKESDQARLEIFRDILWKHLDIDCEPYEIVPYSCAYFLGRHDLKLKLLSENSAIENNTLITGKLTVKFCGKNVEPDQPTNKNLPILIHSCPQNFSTVQYFETLETESIGRLVIYSDVLTSSQDLLERSLCHGLVVIPRQQTKGVGRANNTWISPIGSAMFSLQLHIRLGTPLGGALSLVQHLVAVAVVSAIKNCQGCDKLSIGIKWPNDLYANGNIKIGGLIVKSTLLGDLAVVNVGVGVNLNNPNPTSCLNDLIRVYNQTFGGGVADISYENYFALVFNEIERLLNIVQGGDMDTLYKLYYEYWLHSDANITIKTKEGESRNVIIKGIDDYGFLQVQGEDGSLSSVEPDGNTFDMMKGLLAPKIF